MFREGPGHSPATDDAAPAPALSAKAAGLRYVSDAVPGIRRRKAGAKFTYVDRVGQPLTDPDERLRIKALAIPPAWTDVWICPDPRGHLQATGRDARGRKQYRYHARWSQTRDEAKYERVLAFGEALPGIRRQVEEDLKLTGLPRGKVLAAIVQLLQATLIRVGNDQYARENDSYGLTTMEDQHAHITTSGVRFTFRGKSGVAHSIGLQDRRLARIVKQCRDIPGQRLFQYVADNGEYHSVYSEDVNDYLHEIAGQELSAKDFRTWAGTVLAAEALKGLAPFDSQAEAKRNVVQAIESVAGQLGNTKAVCRKCYVHPAVLEAYLQGSLTQELAYTGKPLQGLSACEAAVLSLLERRLAPKAA